MNNKELQFYRTHLKITSLHNEPNFTILERIRKEHEVERRNVKQKDKCEWKNVKTEQINEKGF